MLIERKKKSGRRGAKREGEGRLRMLKERKCVSVDEVRNPHAAGHLTIQ